MSQLTWGVEVLWSNLGQEGNGLPDKLAVDLVEVISWLLEADWGNAGEVVWSSPLVEESHRTVSLEVSHLVRDNRLVDGELLVVNTDSVSVSIGVGEESGLENRVGRWFDTWNHVRWVESGLFDFGKVVLSSALFSISLTNEPLRFGPR